ncbi:MAG: hypothetical protein IT436_09925 [Phycisphaerales bacterium]|nr:hypothetical protein [Phycisphaerales bacterium]
MADTQRDPDAAMFEGDELLEPPQWPKVVGTISVVWASLGLMCGLCGVANPLIKSYLTTPEMAAQQPPPAPITPLMLASQGAGILNTVLLLTAGIMLLARKPVAKTLHLAYAVISLPLFALGAYQIFQEQARIMEWARQNPDTPSGKFLAGGAGNTMFLMIFIFATVLGLAYPVFCLIWFGAVKRGAPMDVPREQIV